LPHHRLGCWSGGGNPLTEAGTAATGAARLSESIRELPAEHKMALAMSSLARLGSGTRLKAAGQDVLRMNDRGHVSGQEAAQHRPPRKDFVPRGGPACLRRSPVKPLNLADVISTSSSLTILLLRLAHFAHPSSWPKPSISLVSLWHV
jgi:hypothetical protein